MPNLIATLKLDEGCGEGRAPVWKLHGLYEDLDEPTPRWYLAYVENAASRTWRSKQQAQDWLLLHPHMEVVDRAAFDRLVNS